MQNPDFLIIGSGGGGGTIAWQLAKAGFSVLVLEQGPDIAKALDDGGQQFNPVTHDEYRFRLKRPDPKRRPRGDYNTFRKAANETAKPFKNGWTGSVLGGGSVLWGTWSYRALPVDFKLRTHFDALGQAKELSDWGYTVADWPIAYNEMEPFYNVAESLLAVSGDRQSLVDSVKGSAWFDTFAADDKFKNSMGATADWEPKFEYPLPPFPRTPVGQFNFEALDKAGMRPFTLPTAIVTPGTGTYKTKQAIANALAQWPGDRGSFWNKSADELWSERVRDACNMCGYCGEFLCWGKEGPKSGTRASTLKELQDMRNAEIRCNAKVLEITYNPTTSRAKGVKYLDVSNPDNPKVVTQSARHVIVSCGAVQSARLLLMSGPPKGLGNRFDQLGRHATFHLFGFGATVTLAPEFQGTLHGEFGHTGNTTSFAPYFIQNPVSKKWLKAGTLTSTARKNPLENAVEKMEGGATGFKLLEAMETYTRTVQLRLTGDDLPMARNQVDLDPNHVDEYGLPVARITRDIGAHEWQMFGLMEPEMNRIFAPYKQSGVVKDIRITPPVIDLIGDHQMGTVRMGAKPEDSMLNRNCQLHDVKNVFVVDSSFMPSGLGVNPMVSVVANALRIGTWIIEQTRSGNEL